MELARQEYPEMLGSLQPAQAVTVLSERVKRMAKLNIEIADWLQERRKVEEAYVQGLLKLRRKTPPDASSDLGIFKEPWKQIVDATEVLSGSHKRLARDIEVEVEHPLRDFMTRNQDMIALVNIQTNLSAMAKEVENAWEKSDKLKKKGGKAGAEKVANAYAEVETAVAQWDSQAPFVFESFQAADEKRLNHVRDLLTQFLTHEVDQVERDRVSAEGCLNMLLNVQTADEIRAFAAQTTGGKLKIERQHSRTTTAGSALATSRSSQAIEEAVPTLAQPAPRPVENPVQSQRSKTPVGGSKVSQLSPEPKSEKSDRSLLKRFGTVMGKRRQSTLPPARGASPDKRSSDLHGISGRLGRTSRESTLPTNGKSARLSPSPGPDRRSAAQRLDSISSTQRSRSRRSRDPSNGETLGTNSTLLDGSHDGVNGSGGGGGIGGGHRQPRLDQDVPGPPSSLATMHASPEERRDSEGYTVPPSTVDIISQVEREAAEESPSSQFKLDIRNAPIHEEDSDAMKAMANVTNTLRAAVPSRKSGTVRGRRDVRNTIFVPSGQSASDIFAPEPAPLSSPPSLGRAATLQTEDAVTSDTQSVRSARSLSSLAHSVIKHPEMHEAGLQASIVETMHAAFESGQVTKAAIVGELALVCNATNPPAGTTPPKTIRLENFEMLEKVALNPSFVSEVPNRTGEYRIALESLARPAVALKYQIQLDESAVPQYHPIKLLPPEYRTHSDQTSIILRYVLNSAFATRRNQNSPRRSVTLHNVNILMRFTGRASSCQTKPIGTFSKEKSLIWWPLNTITLHADAPPQKLLARLTATEPTVPSTTQVRWDITSAAYDDPALSVGSGLLLTESPVALSANTTTTTTADPFADESVALAATSNSTTSASASVSATTPKPIPTVRKLMTGKYTINFRRSQPDTPISDIVSTTV